MDLENETGFVLEGLYSLRPV